MKVQIPTVTPSRLRTDGESSMLKPFWDLKVAADAAAIQLFITPLEFQATRATSLHGLRVRPGRPF